ncbi:MAG: hemolysin family protein [Muribaculaceae bacterium]|nr:hemolysin family protein [Muribaculaceae bacterium]
MNTSTAIVLIVVLAILLILSAFFSASETAFTSLSQVRIKSLSQTKKSAQLVLKMSENYNKLLSTLLIGNNIVNIVSASIATIVFTFWFGDLGVTLSTIVMTVLVLIFGEITPKSIAKERPEEFAMFSVRMLYVFQIIITPLTIIFNGWKILVNKIFRLNKKRPTMTEEEFSIIVDDIADEGVLAETEAEIIQNTIKFDDTKVEKVMTNAENIVSVCVSDNLKKIKNVFIKSNYSRVPVYNESKQEILGILYRADFYEMLLNGKSNIIPLLKPALFTTSQEVISDLFETLQEQQVPQAIVKDDNTIVGLISMEDILEELVGEIDDKYDY